MKPNRSSLAFGKRLRALRNAAGISQEVLSRKTKLGQEHISLMERGYRLPHFDTMRSLAATFGKERTWELLGL